jgi:uncharacterized protein (DUF302 family)
MMIDSSKGMVNFSGPWSVRETAERIEAVLAAKKIKLFAHIDQSAEAAAVGLTLRPTVLLVFGDPGKGTPLMESYPTLALDLPLKALIWESKPGEVYLSVTSPDFLQKRHQLPFAPFSEVVQLFAGVMDAEKPRDESRHSSPRS